MRKVSIIGSGQAGLILAHALIRKGYDVTLYSDKTADEWLNASRPTGTAYLFHESIQIEREIGIDHWSDTMFRGEGSHIEFALPGGNLASIVTHTANPGGAVDQRMKFHRWLNDLVPAGGKLQIESVDIARAEEIAAISDITILAVGKGELGRIVPRDAERSVYDSPQRRLAMGIVTHVKGWKEKSGITGVKYSKVADGEIFWVPFTHKTVGESWSFIVEAIPGSALDVFGDVHSGAEVTEKLRSVIQAHAPWDCDAVADMRFVEGDDFGWLTGGFPPTVRAAFGKLPSGALVIPVGDTSIAFDPIGGHGGNNASHHAKFLADEIEARNVLPFDAAWATALFDRYWVERGGHAYRFNNIMLEGSPGWEAFLGGIMDPRVADALLGTNVMIPRNFFPWLESAEETAQMIASVRATLGLARGTEAA